MHIKGSQERAKWNKPNGLILHTGKILDKTTFRIQIIRNFPKNAKIIKKSPWNKMTIIR